MGEGRSQLQNLRKKKPTYTVSHFTDPVWIHSLPMLTPMHRNSANYSNNGVPLSCGLLASPRRMKSHPVARNSKANGFEWLSLAGWFLPIRTTSKKYIRYQTRCSFQKCIVSWVCLHVCLCNLCVWYPRRPKQCQIPWRCRRLWPP